MAIDWIKIEIGTPDKPEVFAVAADFDIDPDAAFGKIVRVWIWFDQQTNDGNAPSVTKMFLDRVTNIAGFCDSLIKHGWMTEKLSKIQLPNFDLHNGETAKKRAQSNRRTAKSRSKTQNGNADNVTKESQKPLPEIEIEIDTNIYTEISQIHKKLASAGVPDRWLMRSEGRIIMREWIDLSITPEILGEVIQKAIHSQQGKTFGVMYLNPIVKQLIFQKNNPGEEYGEFSSRMPVRESAISRNQQQTETYLASLDDERAH